MGERIAQVFFELAAFLGIAVQVGGIEVIAPAPAILGGIERQVGVADQRLAGHAIIGRDGDADRGTDHHPVAVDRIGRGKLLDHLVGQIGELLALDLARHDHLKLVAAQTADPAHRADRAFQPLRHLLEQRIARRMAQRVVDLLETIEIEQEHRAGAMLHLWRDQDLFQRLRHPQAVGQAGEQIELRQARGMLGRAALFGQVGARSAKTLEIVERVIGRAAIDLPPALFQVGRRAHGQLGEARPRRQMERQRPLPSPAWSARLNSSETGGRSALPRCGPESGPRGARDR
jgi:hypothetical protein